MGNNLWGNLDDVMEEINNPKDILEEQAKILAESLNGLVEGRVNRAVLNKGWTDFYQGIEQEYDFSYNFDILSDYVEKYSYNMMTIAYGIRMYPVAVSVSAAIIQELQADYNVYDDDTVVADDEEMFKDILKRIFNSKEVRQVLRGLHSIAARECEENQELF